MAFSLGGINCTCCGSAPNPLCFDSCESCTIPKADFPITWVGTGQYPSGGATLRYTGSTTWSTGNLSYDHGATFFDGFSAVPIKYLRIDMYCLADVVTLDIVFVDGSGTDLRNCSTDTGGTGGGRRTAFTCDPFQLTGTYADPPVSTLCFNTAAVDHFTSATVDGSGITGSGCCQTVNVTGCNGTAIFDAVVNIRASSGGTILATGTTDAFGNVTLIWDGGCTQWLEVTYSPEMATSNASTAFTAGSTTNISLSAASGYHCSTLCAVACSDTMHATHPVFGALTYTYSAGNWVSSFSYSYPGLGGCPAKTVTVTCTWNGGNTYTEAWKTATNCPDPAGGTTTTVTWVSGAIGCPPLSGAFVKTFTKTPSGTAQTNMYGASAMTIGITP